MSEQPSAYLLDIEGTTTPIDFVTKTLFPYARQQFADFLAHPDEQLAEDLVHLESEYQADLSQGHAPPAWPARPLADGVLGYIEWLMDQDRKSRALKSMQGRIWEAGYRSGRLKGEIYPDVEPAMRRWKSRGALISIFSSGSVLAQQLLFEFLPSGPLAGLIDHYFDTGVGPKREPASYLSIARRMGIEAGNIHFLSDIVQEVEAAREAGMQGLQVMRSDSAGPGQITTFDGLP